MLITSRETQRWVIPKGWPIKKLGPRGTALQEAYEEAGVVGDAGPSIGAFDYLKVLKKGATRPCEVEVFPLLVVEELDRWPEMDERERRWFTPHDASVAVQEERLGMILAGLSDRLAAPSGP